MSSDPSYSFEDLENLFINQHFNNSGKLAFFKGRFLDRELNSIKRVLISTISDDHNMLDIDDVIKVKDYIFEKMRIRQDISQSNQEIDLNDYQSSIVEECVKKGYSIEDLEKLESSGVSLSKNNALAYCQSVEMAHFLIEKGNTVKAETVKQNFLNEGNSDLLKVLAEQCQDINEKVVDSFKKPRFSAEKGYRNFYSNIMDVLIKDPNFSVEEYNILAKAGADNSFNLDSLLSQDSYIEPEEMEFFLGKRLDTILLEYEQKQDRFHVERLKEQTIEMLNGEVDISNYPNIKEFFYGIGLDSEVYQKMINNEDPDNIYRFIKNKEVENNSNSFDHKSIHGVSSDYRFIYSVLRDYMNSRNLPSLESSESNTEEMSDKKRYSLGERLKAAKNSFFEPEKQKKIPE